MKYISIFLLFIYSLNLKAQEELSLFFHPDVIQSGMLQPAYSPSSNFSLGIGSSYFHMDLRGPKLVAFKGAGSYLKNLASGLSENYLSSDASFNFFDLGFKYKEWHFRTGYNANTNGYFNFSPDLANILLNGNGNSIGKTFDFGPKLYVRQTSEIYIGASYPIYEYYRIGANLKFVSGVFDVSTPRSEVSLTTGSEIYDLTVKTDFLLNASYNSLDFSLRELIPFSNPFQDNIGVSADFGIQYLEEKFDVSASLLDIGVVKWRSNPDNYQSKGEYTFSGFTFDDISMDTLSNLLDTFQNIFGVGITSENYTTYTPLKAVISGEYHFNRNWHLGGILYGEWKQNRFLPAAGINLRKRAWDFWDLGISYAYKNNTYSNLGLSSVMNIGPVQLYALSDNVIGIFLPWNRLKINFRAGANLNIGRFKKPKQAIPLGDNALLF